MVYDESKCRKNFLCDFQLSRDTPDALIEICRFCSKKVIYGKVGGKIDNKKFLRDHIRATVQPFGKTHKLFEKIYGMETMRKLYKELGNKKSKAQVQRGWDEMRVDIRRKMRTIYR